MRRLLILPFFFGCAPALRAQTGGWGSRRTPGTSRPRERVRSGSGWNATAEVDTLFNERWGISAKAGTKPEGFFPGLPLQDGAYVAFGIRGAW